MCCSLQKYPWSTRLKEFLECWKRVVLCLFIYTMLYLSVYLLHSIGKYEEMFLWVLWVVIPEKDTPLVSTGKLLGMCIGRGISVHLVSEMKSWDCWVRVYQWKTLPTTTHTPCALQHASYFLFRMLASRQTFYRISCLFSNEIQMFMIVIPILSFTCGRIGHAHSPCSILPLLHKHPLARKKISSTNSQWRMWFNGSIFPKCKWAKGVSVWILLWCCFRKSLKWSHRCGWGLK